MDVSIVPGAEGNKKPQRRRPVLRPATATGHWPALVIESRQLTMDEHGKGIQPNIVAPIGEVIRRLMEEDGVTLPLVEKKLTFARKYAERFAILDRGRRVVEGRIAEL